jgi:hypothetical protein
MIQGAAEITPTLYIYCPTKCGIYFCRILYKLDAEYVLALYGSLGQCDLRILGRGQKF